MRYVGLSAACLAIAVAGLFAVVFAADPWKAIQFAPPLAKSVERAAVEPPLAPTDQPGVFLGNDGRYWAFGSESGSLCWWDGSQWQVWYRRPKPAESPLLSAPLSSPQPFCPNCPNGRCPSR